MAKRLNLPNEVKYWSKGVTACAICDGAAPMFSGEPLAVVGGGDSAAEEAVYLTKYSPEIHLLVRGTSMRASKALQDRVLGNKKITVHFNTQVLDILGDDPDVPFTKSPVTGVKLAPVTKGGEGEGERELAVRGVFYAIGHDPNTNLFEGFVDIDQKGYVKVGPGTPSTSLEGVFAAGDVQDPHWRQAVTAAGSGCMAALAAERYLSVRGLVREVHQPKDDLARTKGTEAETAAPAAAPVAAAAAGASSSSSSINSHSNSGGVHSMAAAAESDQTNTYHKGETALAELLASSSKPILVMFMSKTCGPCRILKPILGRVLKVRIEDGVCMRVFFHSPSTLSFSLPPSLALNVQARARAAGLLDLYFTVVGLFTLLILPHSPSLSPSLPPSPPPLRNSKGKCTTWRSTSRSIPT